MKNKPGPRDEAAPEQTLQGAPGGPMDIEEGIYKIYSALNNSSVVDMALQGDGNNYHRVKLYRDNSALESTWEFSRRPGGYYVIINQREKALAAGEMTNNNVAATPINGRPGQLWMLKNASGGWLYLENGYDGKVMDVSGSNTADNTSIIDYPHGGTTNQKFRLLKVDGPK